MNPLIQQVLGEHELPGGKLRPEAVLYLNPEQVASEEGCHCGKCVFFDQQTSECFLTAPPACDAEHGVCGLYLGGPSTLTSVTPQNRVSKEAAGYITNAPTHCGNCEYFIKEGENGCQKIGGMIYAAGCCGHWESGEGEKPTESKLSEAEDEVDPEQYIKSFTPISATVSNDRTGEEVKFNCADWFAQATLEQLSKLANREWQSSYEADDVAKFFEDTTLRKFFRKVDEGFEVYISQRDVQNWLQHHRPEWYPLLIDFLDDD